MTIDELIQNFHLQKEAVQELIKKYDKDFSNKKLNPYGCLLYTSPSPRDQRGSRMPSSA